MEGEKERVTHKPGERQNQFLSCDTTEVANCPPFTSSETQQSSKVLPTSFSAKEGARSKSPSDSSTLPSTSHSLTSHNDPEHISHTADDGAQRTPDLLHKFHDLDHQWSVQKGAPSSVGDDFSGWSSLPSVDDTFQLPSSIGVFDGGFSEASTKQMRVRHPKGSVGSSLASPTDRNKGAASLPAASMSVYDRLYRHARAKQEAEKRTSRGARSVVSEKVIPCRGTHHVRSSATTASPTHSLGATTISTQSSHDSVFERLYRNDKRYRNRKRRDLLPSPSNSASVLERRLAYTSPMDIRTQRRQRSGASAASSASSKTSDSVFERLYRNETRKKKKQSLVISNKEEADLIVPEISENCAASYQKMELIISTAGNEEMALKVVRKAYDGREEKAAARLQAAWRARLARRLLARKAFLQKAASAKRIQRAWRSFLSNRHDNEALSDNDSTLERDAAVAIQRIWRQKQLHARAEMVITKIQALWRMKVQHLRYHDHLVTQRLQAALGRAERTELVRSSWRQFITQDESIRTKSAATIQSWWRGTKVRRVVHREAQLSSAATLIQSQWRTFQKARAAASVIESAFRGGRTRQKLRASHRAAEVIQSQWRGFRLREAFFEVQVAASTIQSSYRGARTRELRALHGAATLIQKQWRRFRLRRAFSEVRAAAVSIQTEWRGFKTHKRYAQTRETVAAALMIQAEWRSFQLRRDRERSQVAVASLQSVFRGRHMRKQLYLQRTAVIKLQRLVRQRLKTIHSAAVLVQRHWRMHFSRSFFVCLLNATRFLQAIVRGQLSRTHLLELAVMHRNVCTKQIDARECLRLIRELDDAAKVIQAVYLTSKLRALAAKMESAVELLHRGSQGTLSRSVCLFALLQVNYVLRCSRTPCLSNYVAASDEWRRASNFAKQGAVAIIQCFVRGYLSGVRGAARRGLRRLPLPTVGAVDGVSDRSGRSKVGKKEQHIAALIVQKFERKADKHVIGVIGSMEGSPEKIGHCLFRLARRTKIARSGMLQFCSGARKSTSPRSVNEQDNSLTTTKSEEAFPFGLGGEKFFSGDGYETLLSPIMDGWDWENELLE